MGMKLLTAHCIDYKMEFEAIVFKMIDYTVSIF